jgi:hypothetical protein
MSASAPQGCTDGVLAARNEVHFSYHLAGTQPQAPGLEFVYPETPPGGVTITCWKTGVPLAFDGSSSSTALLK